MNFTTHWPGGPGIDVVWKPFLFPVIIGSVLFGFSLARFSKTMTQMV